MNQISNPLRQFFRQPVIYLRLPSNGEHWPPGSVEFPPNKELPVYPMTAIDEITYRTPDALFNGQAVVNVIESCIPSIRNAWGIPNIDLNSILIAIRIASYGHDMEINSICPQCNTEADYTVDLRNILDQSKSPDYSKTLTFGDLEIIFKPLTYEEQNQSSMVQFEHQKILSMLGDAEIPEEQKVQRLNETLKHITELTIQVIGKSIAAIKAPTAFVTEEELIAEFLNNCDRKVFNSIKDHVVSLREDSEIKPMHVKCGECENEYDQPMNLDMSSFFDSAS
jgi:hypothetical protein